MDLDTTYESKLPNILISSIFIKVCSIYDDVKLYTEHELKGTNVKAYGKVEHVIKRKRKAIIIIESKPSLPDLDQRRTQALVGCEIIAEIVNLGVVYEIVTTFYQWNFYKCLNSCVEKDEIFLLQNGEFIAHALEEVAGKIYAILSE